MSSLDRDEPDTPEGINEFEEYLRTTLGPDLIVSGYVATGEDVLRAAKIIRVLMRFIEEEEGEDLPTPPPPP